MPQSLHSLSIYRQEIIDIEKSRVDLMKWKLILVGGFAAFGLEKFPAIIVLIPFICVYVDALCYQQNLKIFVISKLITQRRQPNLHMDVEYEELCKSYSESFSLEDIALFWSTLILCSIMPFYYDVFTDEETRPIPLSVVILVAITGFLMAIYVFAFYLKYADKLDRKTYVSWVCATGARLFKR